MARKLPETLDEMIDSYNYIAHGSDLSFNMRHLVVETLKLLTELKELREKHPSERGEADAQVTK